MKPAESTFNENRLEAVRRFAQSMIVVDDEANLELEEERVPQVVVRPGRRQARAAADPSDQFGKAAGSNVRDLTHTLDGKLLVDSALEHGLVCSVVRPEPGELALDAVVQAARRVDILCLDWKIHNDDGNTAIALIKRIVRADQSSEGRLRLIVIYTAEHARRRILDRIKKEVSASIGPKDRKRMALKKSGGREIVSNVGLKIVYLVKAHNGQIPKRLYVDRVSEKELPERALEEFAGLCQGLLTSVALGTVAAVRDAANEIAGSFGGEMDAPYFHHRATIRHTDEAEDYAVDTVLSSLRTAVRLQEIGRTFGGRDAVERRVREMAGSDGEFQFLLDQKQGEEEKSISFPVNDVVRMVNLGVDKTHGKIKIANLPGKRVVQKNFTSFFVTNARESRDVMKRFAALTSVESHPRTVSVRTGEYIPSLGLGTVIVENSGKYLLCIQASCDAVRITEPRPFLFVPLEVVEDGGEFVVPRESQKDRISFVALKVEELGYAKGKSIVFSPDGGTERVLVSKRGRPKKLRFKSINRQTFEWVADLKHYQALNVAQKLGQKMGRLGFDEFEPYRTLDR